MGEQRPPSRGCRSGTQQQVAPLGEAPRRHEEQPKLPAACHHGGMDLWALSDLRTPWCLRVVTTLRIADHILAGSTQIDQLAAASGADAASLHRVLRHLVSRGLFEEPALGLRPGVLG